MIKQTKLLKRWKLNNKESYTVERVLNKSTFSLSEVLTAVIVTAIVSALVGFTFAESVPVKSYEALSSDVQDFLADYSDIKDRYYGDFDEKVLLNDALKTIISKLDDDYTQVVDDELAANLRTTLSGTYEGIGLSVYNNKEDIVVYTVIDDSPALKAGIKSGDIILSMNGESLKNVSTTDFANKVKECNSNIVLSINRDGAEMSVNIKRELVTLQSIYTETYERNSKKVGYIYISVFAANSGSQFEKALVELKDVDSLIIDVRSNTGGHLTSAVDIMNAMLDSKHVIYQIENKDKVTKYYSEGKKTYNKKIVMLVNEYSASASEMITAAFKEELNATVVGKNTFGKGTVQDVLNTTSGVEYKITTSKWLTPKGNWIHKTGIKPDYEVDLDESYLNDPSDENDAQLQKAIEILTK